jgi:hypothetical protein
LRAPQGPQSSDFQQEKFPKFGGITDAIEAVEVESIWRGVVEEPKRKTM